VGAVGGRNFGLPIDLAHRLLLQQLVATAQAVIIIMFIDE